jgi:DNA-binding CsgD family transcriptional regulator/PAS domain-containing protein
LGRLLWASDIAVGVLAMAREADDGELLKDFEELSLPLVAVDLQEMRIVAATPSALSLVGFPPGKTIGAPVLDVIVPGDRKRAKLAFDALAHSAVDFYRATNIRLVGRDERRVYTSWAAAVELAGRPIAVIQVVEGAFQQLSPLARFLGTQSVELTFGTANRDWVITSVSSSVERLLGLAAEDVTGRLLLGAVEERDVNRVLAASLEAKAEVSVGLSVRMRGLDDEWRYVHVVLGALASSTDWFFILAPQAGPDLRGVKLEEHLRRIAVEVQASGILEITPTAPGLARLVGRGGLTPRQWDVLTRMVRGARVSTIAEELFMSESTVRNHLSAIYERLGVRSQAELMALALDDKKTSG